MSQPSYEIQSPGKFISLEGCEGCGKSTQALRLKAYLEQHKQSVLLTREPGGTPTGEMIRDLLQHHASGEDITTLTEVMLFAASRAQHVTNVIRPALADGTWVICDRFVDSSLAYQAGGRGVDFQKVLSVNEVALDGCWPDLTFWFEISAEASFARVEKRGGKRDRFESEAFDFHKRVVEMYGELKNKFPNRIVQLNGELSMEAVHEEVLKSLREKRLLN